MKLQKLKELYNHKIAILGFGKEGKSSLEFLLKLGFINITILDKDETIEREEDINYILGKKYLDNLGDFNLIFKTPGISPYDSKINSYKEKLITQAQIFFNNYKGKIIGITGTKGKSTTSVLTYEVLKQIGYDTKIVGNIGNPVLDEVNIINNENHDFIVYELSSYMLEGLTLSPFIGVINNIYDCHLGWHHGKENYTNAKLGIILNAENKLVNFELKTITNKVEKVKYFGDEGNYYFKKGLFYKNEQLILKDEKIALQGEHNRKNITAILGILDIIDPKTFSSNIKTFKKVLSTFTGLPHRIQKIGEYNGIIFIDDAIATTPESTIAALNTYEHNIGTIILGGQDGGFNYSNLIKVLEKYNISNIVLFPDTGERIFGDLSDYKYEEVFSLQGNYSPKILKTKSMESAINFAYQNTEKGKICILSNAAPSYNLWSGYIEKGEQFQNEVKKQYKKKLIKYFLS